MNRTEARAFMTACAAGAVDLTSDAVCNRLEAIVEEVEEDDAEMCRLAALAAGAVERVAVEMWAARLGLAVVEQDDPATEIQALRAIGRARAG